MIERTASLSPSSAATESDDRKTGWSLSLALASPALWVWLGSGKLWLWTVPPAIVLALLNMLAPHKLSPLIRIFRRISELLHRTLSNVALAVVFFAVVTPMGAMLRTFRRDSMPLKNDPSADSYWLSADEKPWKEYFNDQF